MGEHGSRRWNAVAAVRSCAIAQWSGAVWRFHSRRYPGDSHGGSLLVSGRFHRGADRYQRDERWPALYTSLRSHVALGERLRHTTPATLALLRNQSMSQLEVALQAVLIGCDPDDGRAVAIKGINAADFCTDDYQSTQEFARHAREIAEAILVPSCTQFEHGNLILFPDRLRPGSTVRLVATEHPDLYVEPPN